MVLRKIGIHFQWWYEARASNMLQEKQEQVIYHVNMMVSYKICSKVSQVTKASGWWNSQEVLLWRWLWVIESSQVVWARINTVLICPVFVTYWPWQGVRERHAQIENCHSREERVVCYHTPSCNGLPIPDACGGIVRNLRGAHSNGVYFTISL